MREGGGGVREGGGGSVGKRESVGKGGEEGGGCGRGERGEGRSRKGKSVYTCLCSEQRSTGSVQCGTHTDYLCRFYSCVYTRTRTRTGRGSDAGPHVYTYISRTRIFQDPGPLGTVFLTVPADLGPGPDQLNQRFKHTWLFAVSIERVKMAPELVYSVFVFVGTSP